MKPQLYVYESEQGNEAYLVDQDSIFIMEDDHGTACNHFAAAVDIGRIRSGPIVAELKDGRSILLHPKPCVLQYIKEMKIVGLLARGIDPKAAAVLLDLARAANDVKVEFGKQEWSLCGPAVRGVREGWDGWKFVAAWKWSAWESKKITGAQRHRVMKDLGYPKAIGTMRKMMADLGLVTRRKKHQ